MAGVAPFLQVACSTCSTSSFYVTLLAAGQTESLEVGSRHDLEQGGSEMEWDQG